MTKRRRVTIKDVARAAGVSTQTVSRVINDRPDVAEETRQQVTLVIDRLGYRPSAIARSLIRQRSFTIGVVTAGLKYIGPSRTLNGIADQAEQSGYALLLKELPSFQTREVEPIIDSLLYRHVEGIIWAVPQIGDNHEWLYSRLPDLNLPIVFLTMEDHPDLSIVYIDNYAGGCMAARHLLEQGYRRIGHITGPLDWWEAQQRQAGWQQTLEKAGLGVEPAHSAEGNWSSASGARAAVRLLEQYPRLDAIFAANDQMALGAIHVLGERGRRVPQDVGVIGFDGISEAAYFRPPLSTIDQDQHKLGCGAVTELLKRIEGGHEDGKDSGAQSVLLRPQLIVRQSTAR